jgi:hypothetical protein
MSRAIAFAIVLLLWCGDGAHAAFSTLAPMPAARSSPAIALLTHGEVPVTGAVVVTGVRFMLPHGADNGTTHAARGNVPSVQLRHLATGETRMLTHDPAFAYGDRTWRSMAGALLGFPSGPADLTVASNGLRSRAVTIDVMPGAPMPPPIGMAVAGNARALVPFGVPEYDGGQPVTSYRVTAAPGGASATCTVPCSALIVAGLVNGTEYRFTVQAINAFGTGAASPLSNRVTPSSDCAGSTLTSTITLQQAPSCAASTDGALLVTAGGGVAPYTYRWTPGGAQTALLSGIGAGSYTSEVTDALACTHQRTHVLQAPLPLAASTIVQSIAQHGQCTGGIVVLNPSGGTPPYQYAWAPTGQTTANATGLCAGLHTLTLTDANQCIRVSKYQVFEPPSAPGLVGVTAGNAEVGVAFTGPASNGGATIEFYRATCGSVSAEGGGSPITVTGLENGVAVTCSVRAHNAYGVGDRSAVSAPVTPQAPQTIVFGIPPDLHVGQTGTVTAMGGGSGNPVTFDARTPAICSIDANSGLVTAVAAGACTIAANQAGGAAYLPAPESLLTFDIGAVRFLVTPSALLGTIAPAAPQWIEEGERATFEITPGASGMQSRVEGSCGGTLTGSTIVTEPITQDCTVIGRFFTVPVSSNPVTPVPIEGGIRFEFVPQYDGGSPILDFTITCDPGAWSITAPAPPITLTGLIDHTIYRCRLRARNAAGLSPLQSPFTAIPGSIGDTADVGISIDNGTDFVDGGQPVVYTMTVTNHGPGTSYFTGAEVLLTAELPSGSWTCEPQSGGHCRSAAGSIEDGMLMDLARDGSVRYRVSMTPAPGAETPLSIVASAEGFRMPDPDLTNNVASDGPDIRGIFRNGLE